MNTAAKVALASLGIAAWIGGAGYLLSRDEVDSEGAAPPPDPPDDDDDEPQARDEAPPADAAPAGDEVAWTDALPMPTADDVRGDLETNWGMTPVDLRPLFLLLEEASGIRGAGRIFAVIAHGESRFVANAHNGADDSPRSQRERAASRRAYDTYKESRPPLRFGEQAAAFGSGGLFGALAPFFLWTGIVEVGQRAPLLRADPRVMFLPRVAGFAACVYLMRLVRHYRIDDHLDLKAGWASPSLLVGEGREGETYAAVRKKFAGHADALGIDLEHALTIPAVLELDEWPGVLELFDALVGAVPQGERPR